ncbi:hypothetical protein P4K96_27030 [Bacillus cereus]|nr:hypothetical protein [Paenibacillus dendritiformis]MEB9897077.1 hypothetical protein [Bacillus cereus]
MRSIKVNPNNATINQTLELQMAHIINAMESIRMIPLNSKIRLG